MIAKCSGVAGLQVAARHACLRTGTLVIVSIFSVRRRRTAAFHHPPSQPASKSSCRVVQTTFGLRHRAVDDDPVLYTRLLQRTALSHKVSYDSRHKVIDLMSVCSDGECL